MLTRVFYFLTFYLLACTAIAGAAEDRSLGARKKTVAAERRLALVIGNSGYADAPLKNPVNDADAMVKTLKETGFEVVVRKNADRRAMYAAIKEFGQKLRKNDVGLVYYAGHGVQVDSANYLLPVDLKNSDLQDADDLRRDALPLNDLMERMRDAGTNNIVILDACRDNPFLAKLSRSASRGLAKVVTPASTTVLYATDPGNTASDGASSDNGIFTRRLVEAINKEGLELVDVMREVALAVNRDTAGAQRPVFDGVLSSKFFFKAPEVPAPKAVEPPPPAITVDPRAVDLRYWESAEKANTVSAYKSYLKKFPNGDFAEMAAEKIELLQAAKVKADTATKAELERRAQDVAEQTRLAKERIEQDRRMKELEAKFLQAEERARLIEERAAKALKAQETAGYAPKVELATQKTDSRPVTNPQTESAPKQQLAMIQKAETRPVVNIESELAKILVKSELTVTDKRSGLMWVKNGNIVGERINYGEALSFISQLNENKYAGYKDWRLPTYDDFKSLFDTAKKEAEQINKKPLKMIQETFTDYQEWNYWMSTKAPGSTFNSHRSAYTFDLEYGSAGDALKIDTLNILPVRGKLAAD